MHLGTRLRKLINERRGLLVPGAGNALAARVIEDAGLWEQISKENHQDFKNLRLLNIDV